MVGMLTEGADTVTSLQDIVDDGLISSAQLEAVLYANMCFKVFLEGPGQPHKIPLRFHPRGFRPSHNQHMLSALLGPATAKIACICATLASVSPYAVCYVCRIHLVLTISPLPLVCSRAS